MNDLDELILKLQEGALSPEELRRLNLCLRSPETRQRLYDSFALSGMLSEAFHSGQLCGEQKIVPFPAKRWLAGIATAAACLLLLFFLSRPSNALNASVIPVTGTIQVQRGGAWTTQNSPFQLKPGDLVQAQPSSSARIEFGREKTRVQLTGGTELRIRGTDRHKELIVLAGSIAAKVAPQPNPMRLRTPQAEATVIGTEFRLSTLPNSTRLEVNEGEVSLRRLADGSILNLHSGQFATACRTAEFTAHDLPSLPWQSTDVGAVQLHGSSYMQGEICRVKAAGRNTCRKKDQLHFTYREIAGDFDFRARLASFSSKSSEALAGLMVRRSLNSACQQVFVAVRGDGHVEFQHRASTENLAQTCDAQPLPLWLRLVRKGQAFQAFFSREGSEWTEIGHEQLLLPNSVSIGMAVSSHQDGELASSEFEQITVLNDDSRNEENFL